MFVVFCSAYHCSEGKPRRLIRRWYGLDETLGGAFGFAMVWERESREHKANFWFHGAGVLDLADSDTSLLCTFLAYIP